MEIYSKLLKKNNSENFSKTFYFLRRFGYNGSHFQVINNLK